MIIATFLPWTSSYSYKYFKEIPFDMKKKKKKNFLLAHTVFVYYY